MDRVSIAQMLRQCCGKVVSFRVPDKETVFPWLLVLCGTIGLLAAFILTVDAIKLAGHPSARLDCNINPIISCGSVMRSSEASLFGFTNSLLGIPAFTVVLVLGVLVLSGAEVKRWVWVGLTVGAFGGVVLTHWLMIQSIYHIHALCPYCMVTWLVTMLVFMYTFLRVLPPNHVGRFLNRHHGDMFLLWLLSVASLLLTHFWYFFRTLL